MLVDMPPPFDAGWFRFIAGFIIGSVFGSFATMLAYRLPRRLSIVAPRSRCPTCRATLRPRDLVPLLSWLSSRGKCRHCGTAIGLRYFLIELSVSLAFGLLFAIMPLWLNGN